MQIVLVQSKTFQPVKPFQDRLAAASHGDILEIPSWIEVTVLNIDGDEVPVFDLDDDQIEVVGVPV